METKIGASMGARMRGKMKWRWRGRGTVWEWWIGLGSSLTCLTGKSNYYQRPRHHVRRTQNTAINRYLTCLTCYTRFGNRDDPFRLPRGSAKCLISRYHKIEPLQVAKVIKNFPHQRGWTFLPSRHAAILEKWWDRRHCSRNSCPPWHPRRYGCCMALAWDYSMSVFKLYQSPKVSVFWYFYFWWVLSLLILGLQKYFCHLLRLRVHIKNRFVASSQAPYVLRRSESVWGWG